MYNSVINKIKKAKILIEPFPHLVVENLIPKNKLKHLNSVLPSFDEVSNKDCLLQSKSKTKKTILPDSKTFKKLSKQKIFKDINSTFKNIQPILVKKFKKQIEINLKKKYHKSKLDYHLSFSLMKKNYIKSPHLDRREHMIHGLFYPTSCKTGYGGNLLIKKIKKKQKIYDVFPPDKELKTHKKIGIKKNICIFVLNTPQSYHSVDRYKGNEVRKYLYFVYVRSYYFL